SADASPASSRLGEQAPACPPAMGPGRSPVEALMAWDPSTDPIATAGFATCDRVLERVGERADALVTCGQGTNALTRFANSRIHQNMASDEAHVRLRVVVDDGR